MHEMLAVLAAFAVVYSAVAGRVERTIISGPMIFIAFGVLVGPVGMGLLGVDTDPEVLRGLAELTLALVLFTDAAGTDFAVLRRVRSLPLRLLVIGLPLTILAGFGVGKLLFGAWTVYEIALLATMLAPTDAALGKPVITNESVPNGVRQALSVESGLNDGICVPILFLFLALAEGQFGDQEPWTVATTLFLRVVGIGLACGLGLTLIACLLLRFCHRRGWLSQAWTNMTVIAIAFMCFGSAETLGGSGFISAFVGGLLFGRMMDLRHKHLLIAAEGVGDLFALLTWVLFGAAVVGQAVERCSWQIIAYAALSLTIIRMAPVFLAVSGLGESAERKLFIGWFGPRGLASIVFAVLVADAALPHGETITAVVAWTVILSIIAHGVTANPWARAFGSREGNAEMSSRPSV